MADIGALALLHVTAPDGTESVAPVTQSPFNIGRAPGNHLELPHPLVSRNHARLLVRGGEVVLIDLNSSNGTLVGAQRLGPSEPYALGYGVAFQIGPFTLALEPAPRVTATPWPNEVAEEPPSRPSAIIPAPEDGVTKPPQPPCPPDAAQESDGDSRFGLPEDASRYMQYLPPIYQVEPFLGRFLLAFEGILAPIEQTVDNMDLYLSPRTVPAFFLDRLADWLGLVLDEKWPLEKRRAVLAEAAELYRMRGTRRGLARHVELYAGVAPEIDEPQDQPFHFCVRLQLPPGHDVDRATLERIILANKPAHTTFALEIVEQS
ncbi:MAG: FHA domain-containing protein [Anaerolineae bacterium]